MKKLVKNNGFYHRKGAAQSRLIAEQQRQASLIPALHATPGMGGGGGVVPSTFAT